MEQKICISSMTPERLAEFLKEMGEPSYRAGQIFKWLSMGISSFDEMSNLSKKLRSQLDEKCFIEMPKLLRKQVSAKDGTIKYLFGLSDGNSIESVLMEYKHGNSICISTQAGCKMGCVFCASFDPARSRNLSAGEILSQILLAEKDSGKKVSNIVLMGTGEPLDNYANVLDFLRIVSAPGGLNIGMRHISLSTCGLVPKIDELAKEDLQLTLSVSLHAPNNQTRDKIMPVNHRYPIEELIPACKRYFDVTHRRISFEYAMIKDVNDSKADAIELANLLKGFLCHVNLIPLNKLPWSPLIPSTPKNIRVFQETLEARGINTTVRRSLGGDIDAACGQLRVKSTL